VLRVPKRHYLTALAICAVPTLPVLPSPLAAAPLRDHVTKGDRSGPPRRARCRIGAGPVQPCIFTPLFGDGSFNIEPKDGNDLRVVRDGDHAWVFSVFGPNKRVPVGGTYHRDKADRACWVADAPNSEPDPGRICAY
jgi:hypothetical protein